MLSMDNRSAFFLFLTLLAIAVGSYAWTQRPSPVSKLFPQMDTAMIEYIRLRHPQDSCLLQRNKQQWIINQHYEIDPFILQRLFEVLQSAHIRRKLSGKEANEIQKQLTHSGCHVDVAFTQQKLLKCTIWGEETSRRSYISLKNVIYEFNLPREANYLAPLFFLREIQWRTRRIFSSDVYTLKELRISYPKHPENDLYIRITPHGPSVDGLNEVDSLALYAYLDQYEIFYTNEYIEEGQVPAYDSLLSTQPIADIRVDDLYETSDQEIKIYARADDSYFLLQESDGSRSLCARKRFQSFLRKKQFFKPQKTTSQTIR